MNESENPVEQLNAALSENAVETGVLENERQADTLAETFTQIREIQKGGGVDAAGVDGVAEEIARRLKVDLVQLDAVKEAINFTERTTTLVEKKKTLKEKFDAVVQKSLLPVATALAMNTAPVLAQESQTDRPVTTPEATLVAKSESRELKKNIFDLSSPLNVVGEKMKAFKREMLPEELALIKEFHKKAWEEENEWMAVSGRGKQGQFHSEIKEAGRAGGELIFDTLEEIVSEQSVNHTHPVAVGSLIGLSPETIQSIHKKEINSFIMPPSTVDIGGCMNDAGTDTVQRVVDPRGVWEYRCDEQHPFVVARKRVVEDLSNAVEEVKTKYGVRDDDIAQASSALGTTHPALMMQSLFSELDKKYPGIEKSGQTVLTKIVARNSDFALAMLSYEGSGGILTRGSQNLSEVELSNRIQKFIQGSEKIGVYMSYKPFKELPKNKLRTQ